MKNSKIEKLKKLLKSPGLSKGVRESTESQIEKLTSGLKKNKPKPKIKAEVTDVVFLIDGEGEDQDLFAFFYNEPENNKSGDDKSFMAYSHVGQHSAASLGYAKESRLATPKEYKDLKKELESPPYGYNLVVAKSKSVLNKEEPMKKSALETAKEKAKTRKLKIDNGKLKIKKEKDWKEDALKLLKKETDNSDLEITREESDNEFVAESGNTEYRVFRTYSDAERVAEEYVKDMLDDDPENFSSDWLSNHLYVSDTDKRIIAGEEADNQIENMDEEDIIQRSGDHSVSDWEDEEDEDKKEKMLEESKETLHDEIYNEWYKGLDKDPIGFLVDDQGLYSKEDALKQSFIQIDTNKAAADAVETDGVAHFLSSYDGKQIEDFGNTYVAYRTN